jgi:RNA polymerase sigma-70 factor (ECF subfamily)
VLAVWEAEGKWDMADSASTAPEVVTDEQLVGLIRAGDRDAFETLYRKFFPRIYRFVHNRMGNRSDVEETVQEIFIAAFSSLSAYRGEAPFGAWVYGLSRRTIANRFKRKRAETVPWSDTDVALADAANAVRDDANAPDPHAAYERSERLAQLESAAQQLTPSQWEYFRLHHLEDVSIKDIARRGGLSRDAVKSHLYRARKLLLER